MEFAYKRETAKSFDDVVKALEQLSPEHQFRVLAVHDVQETLEEKGFTRGPLKIIEVCNAGFAYQALEKNIDAALFMPCRYTVHTEGGKTVVKLGLPSMISTIMPDSGLGELAADVEARLITILDAAV